MKGELNTKPFKRANSFKLASGLLSLCMVILSCIFLLSAPAYVLMIAFLIFASLGVAIASIDPTKKESLFKSLFVLLVTLSVMLLVYIILSLTGVLAKIQSTEQLVASIRSTGIWGALIFTLFIIVNVIFLPVPSAISAIVGTILFGPLVGFILMSIGTVIGSIITFVIGRYAGKKVVVWMIGKEKTEKYANFLSKKGKFAFVLMIILPLFPDDIMCLIAGLSNMSYKFFIGVICTVRVAVLAFICFFADGSIIPFRGWGLYVWIGLGALIILASVVGLILKKKFFEKNKRIKP